MLNPISNKTIELILNVKEKDSNSIILMEERLKKLESIIEK